MYLNVISERRNILSVFIFFVSAFGCSAVFSAEIKPSRTVNPTSFTQDLETLEQKIKELEEPVAEEPETSAPSEWVGRFMVSKGSAEICAMKFDGFKGRLAEQILTLSFDNMGTSVTFELPLNEENRFEGWQMLSFHYLVHSRTLRRLFNFSGSLRGNTVTGSFYAEATRVGDLCDGKIHFVKKGSIEERAFLEGRDPRVMRLEHRLHAIELSQSMLKNNRAVKEIAKELTRYRQLREQQQARLNKLKQASAEQEQALAGIKKELVSASVPLTVATQKDFGHYHALIIGIDRYKNLPTLKTAVTDANAVADVLARDYGFDVIRLINPSRDQILDQLDALRTRLSFNDNLLIYYSGHGSLDRKADEGYWLPVNAHSARRSRWISNNTITTTLRAIDAKHILIVADSCYTGRLTRGISVVPRRPQNLAQLKKMAQKKTRVVLTSGGLQPVDDSNDSGHSAFAGAFLKALKENNGIFDGTSLFKSVHRPTQVDSKGQEPQYSDVRQAGHDGGDFIFVKRAINGR